VRLELREVLAHPLTVALVQAGEDQAQQRVAFRRRPARLLRNRAGPQVLPPGFREVGSGRGESRLSAPRSEPDVRN